MCGIKSTKSRYERLCCNTRLARGSQSHQVPISSPCVDNPREERQNLGEAVVLGQESPFLGLVGVASGLLGMRERYACPKNDRIFEMQVAMRLLESGVWSAGSRFCFVDRRKKEVVGGKAEVLPVGQDVERPHHGRTVWQALRKLYGKQTHQFMFGCEVRSLLQACCVPSEDFLHRSMLVLPAALIKRRVEIVQSQVSCLALSSQTFFADQLCPDILNKPPYFRARQHGYHHDSDDHDSDLDELERALASTSPDSDLEEQLIQQKIQAEYEKIQNFHRESYVNGEAKPRRVQLIPDAVRDFLTLYLLDERSSVASATNAAGKVNGKRPASFAPPRPLRPQPARFRTTGSTVDLNDLPRLIVLLAIDHSAFFAWLLSEGYLDLSTKIVPSLVNCSAPSAQQQESGEESFLANKKRRRIMKDESSSSGSEKKQECVICWDEIRPDNEYRLLCGHVFCHTCVFNSCLKLHGVDVDGQVYLPETGPPENSTLTLLSETVDEDWACPSPPKATKLAANGRTILCERENKPQEAGAPAGLGDSSSNQSANTPLACFYVLVKDTCPYCRQKLKPKNLSDAFALQLLLSGVWRTRQELKNNWAAVTCVGRVEAGTTLGQALVCLAAASGAVQTLATLIEHGGVDLLRGSTLGGRNVLHYAVQWNRHEVLHWLSQWRGDADGRRGRQRGSSDLKRMLQNCFRELAQQSARVSCVRKKISEPPNGVPAVAPAGGLGGEDAGAPMDVDEAGYVSANEEEDVHMNDGIPPQAFGGIEQMEVEEEMGPGEGNVLAGDGGGEEPPGNVSGVADPNIGLPWEDCIVEVVGPTPIQEVFFLDNRHQLPLLLFYYFGYILYGEGLDGGADESSPWWLSEFDRMAFFGEENLGGNPFDVSRWKIVLEVLHPDIANELTKMAARRVLSVPTIQTLNSSSSSMMKKISLTPMTTKSFLTNINLWELFLARRPDIVKVFMDVGIMEFMQEHSLFFTQSDDDPLWMFRAFLAQLLRATDDYAADVLRTLVTTFEGWGSLANQLLERSYQRENWRPSGWKVHGPRTGWSLFIDILVGPNTVQMLDSVCSSSTASPGKEKLPASDSVVSWRKTRQQLLKMRREAVASLSEKNRSFLCDLKTVALLSGKVDALKDRTPAVRRPERNRESLLVVFDSDHDSDEEDADVCHRARALTLSQMFVRGASLEEMQAAVDACVNNPAALQLDSNLKERFLRVTSSLTRFPEVVSDLWKPLHYPWKTMSRDPGLVLDRIVERPLEKSYEDFEGVGCEDSIAAFRKFMIIDPPSSAGRGTPGDALGLDHIPPAESSRDIASFHYFDGYVAHKRFGTSLLGRALRLGRYDRVNVLLSVEQERDSRLPERRDDNKNDLGDEHVAQAAKKASGRWLLPWYERILNVYVDEELVDGHGILALEKSLEDFQRELLWLDSCFRKRIQIRKFSDKPLPDRGHPLSDIRDNHDAPGVVVVTDVGQVQAVVSSGLDGGLNGVDNPHGFWTPAEVQFPLRPYNIYVDCFRVRYHAAKPLVLRIWDVIKRTTGYSMFSHEYKADDGDKAVLMHEESIPRWVKDKLKTLDDDSFYVSRLMRERRATQRAEERNTFLLMDWVMGQMGAKALLSMGCQHFVNRMGYQHWMSRHSFNTCKPLFEQFLPLHFAGKL